MMIQGGLLVAGDCSGGGGGGGDVAKTSGGAERIEAPEGGGGEKGHEHLQGLYHCVWYFSWRVTRKTGCKRVKNLTHCSVHFVNESNFFELRL